MHQHGSCGDSRPRLSGRLEESAALSQCRRTQGLSGPKAVEPATLILTQPTYNSTSTLATTAAGVPTLAIVGRPNVGKSTLFNRIVGSRRAIVGDEPGITRDRLYGDAEWRGRHLRIVDTGGILPEEKDFIPSEIFRQARVALDEAAAIVMVVDGRSELAGPDLELVRLLRKADRPLFLAVNKVDGEKQSALVHNFHRLGIREMFPVSAEHGRGIDDLLDAILRVLPEAQSPEQAPEESSSGVPPAVKKAPRPRSRKHLDSLPVFPDESETANDQRPATNDDSPAHETKVAIIGHPNVGKSTLLNALTASDRAIVSPIPGTTMDSVDTEVEHDGHFYNFVDTAGIRRKGKTTLVAEKLSVVMARRGLERADVALLVVDAEQGVTQGDAQIANYAEQSGRSVIIVMNKWDLAVEAARKAAERAAATSKGQARRDAHDRRTEAAAKYSTTAQSRAKFKAGEARAAASRANRGKDSSHKSGSREYSYAGATQGVHGFGDQDKSRLLFDYEKLVRDKLKFLSYAPIVFLSAKTGDRATKLFPLIDQVAAARRKRIPTPELNRWLKEEVDLQRGTTPKARPVKIYYLVQAKTSPPTFLLFTNQKDPLHFSYQRFLENQIREKWDFPGAPIRFVQRLRKAERDTRTGNRESRAEAREAERKKHGPRLMREHETKEIDE